MRASPAIPSPGLPFPVWSRALDRRERRLAGAALGLSLAVHLAVLGLAPDWRASHPPETSTIQVTLLSPPPAPAPTSSPARLPAPAPVAVPTPPAPQPKALPTPSRPIVVARRDSAPTAPRVTQPPPEPATTAVEAISAPAAPAPAAQATAQPTAPPAPAAPTETAPAADPTLLVRYGQTLSELLARNLRYPRLAAARGWEGDVVVKLVIARKGRLVSARVFRSSGHAVLDENALELVNAVQSFPPLPSQTGDDDLEVTVPVHYHLDKKG